MYSVQKAADALRASAEAGRWRRLSHIAVPVMVLLAIGTLVLINAGAALTRATPVDVAAVVFDRGAPALVAPAADRHSGSRSGATVTAPGWLEADPFFVACAALADGVVSEMLVLEGDYVEQGQIVARLVAEDAELELVREQAHLARAEAEILMAKAELTAAQADWDHPVERDRAVESSRAALAETNAMLAQLPSHIAQEQAMLVRFEEELERSEDAHGFGASSEIELIILRQQVAAQSASLDARLKEQQVLEAKRDQLASELKAAERNAELRIEERRALNAAIAMVAQREANAAYERAKVAEAQLRVDRMTIHAPISGYVQRRLKAPGDKVMMDMDSEHSAHIIHLYDPSMIQVRVDVPLADAAQISIGQACEVVVDVLPDETFRGEVTRITHEADLQKNTLQVKVRVIDPSPMLRPEMLTRVRFLGARSSASAAETPIDTIAVARVLAPTDSLRDERNGVAHVWVVRSRRGDVGAAQSVAVEIGQVEDGWAQVEGALRPGDLVVTSAVDLDSGQRVRMRPQGGGAS